MSHWPASAGGVEGIELSKRPVVTGGVESWQGVDWCECQAQPWDIESGGRTQMSPQDLGGPAHHLAGGGQRASLSAGKVQLPVLIPWGL